jgi:hypothetical protein
MAMPTWLDEFEESLRRTGATDVLPPTPARPPARLDAPPRRTPINVQAPLGFTPPPTNALGPQTEQEARGYERSRDFADLIYNQLPMAMAPYVRGPGMLGNTARGVARVLGMQGSAPGVEEAQGPPTEPENVLQARRERDAAKKRMDDLTSSIHRLDPSRITSLAPQDRTREVREIQKDLGRITDAEGNPLYRGNARDRQGRWQPGPVDGMWGGGTTAAAGAHRRQLQADLERARTEYDRLDGTLNAAVRQTNRDTAEGNMSPWDRFVRDNASALGLAAGAAGGSLMAWPLRWGTVGLTNRFHRGRVETANNLLPPLRADGRVAPVTAANAPGRFANVNRFYDEGGGTEPFRQSRTAMGGWTENRVRGERFARADNLYDQSGLLNNQFVRPQDALPMSLLLGTNYLSSGRVATAEREVERAREEARRNGSRENLENLTRAEAALAYARIYERATQTAPLSYGPTLLRRYDISRPAVERGQAEVGRLSRWRRGQP